MGLWVKNLFAESVGMREVGAIPAGWGNATETKLLASDGAAGDQFGFSVSMAGDGSTVIAGAYQDDDNGSDSGAAYVYKWNGTSWDETKLIASDGAVEDYFGYSVAISDDGNTALIGAYLDDDLGTSSGSAYIYRWNGTSWAETKLLASDGAAADYFGYSVAISEDGNTALIGAYRDDDNGTESGSAYIYKWNGTSWDETKLIASDGAADDRFGWSVSMAGDGNTALIGAYLDDDMGTDSGSAYIYKWNGTGWDETKLTASDGAASDFFGYSVSVSGDGNTALMGAYGDDDNGTDSGSAYIYKWNGLSWDETKLVASDIATLDLFAASVAMSGDGNTAIVGAMLDDDNGNASGSAYVYRWNGTSWDETKLIASDGAAEDRFGYSVSMSGDGNTAIVGARLDDDNGSASGSAYVYRA